MEEKRKILDRKCCENADLFQDYQNKKIENKKEKKKRKQYEGSYAGGMTLPKSIT